MDPYEADQVNPASYDVTLGNTIQVENSNLQGPRWVQLDISEREYLLTPGEFVLAHTAETVRVPHYLEATFQLKSSRGREGYEHALAGYIDPGFTGQVTLELSNLNRFHKIPLFAGLRIGQLRFMKMDEAPLRPYSVTGRYNGDTGAVASKG